MSNYQQITDNVYVRYPVRDVVKKGCAGKRVYTSPSEAKEVAEYRSKIIGEELHAYKCRWCSCIHIGHDRHAERNINAQVECPYGCEGLFYKSKLNEHLDECPSYIE